MSGGRWGYQGAVIRVSLLQVGLDAHVSHRWPHVTAAFVALAEEIYTIEHDMDWDLSGDSVVLGGSNLDDAVRDSTFDAQQFGILLTALLKVAPDEWFPRGKWATIQAFQERAGI